jgi:hypothetical protein
MSEIICFWSEPTDNVRLWLRRYSGSADHNCATTGYYCNGQTPFGDHPAKKSPEGYLEDRGANGPPRDDARWPTRCDACGRPFEASDEWQVHQDQIYRRVDTGAEFELRKAAPGAMWDAWWYPPKGPDGKSLAVALPPGGGDDVWMVDAPSKGGSGWTRSGVVPNVTANPSILTPRYHGYLRSGKPVSC